MCVLHLCALHNTGGAQEWGAATATTTAATASSSSSSSSSSALIGESYMGYSVASVPVTRAVRLLR